MLERDEPLKKIVAATIMANAELERALHPYGTRGTRSSVGTAYATEKMREHGLALGGEQSDHLLEHNNIGDGMIASLRGLVTLIRRDLPLSARPEVYRPLPKVQDQPKGARDAGCKNNA